MTEERILDRVRKMLALANDSAASEGERDNALRMAYNLLAKHNLSVEDVKRRGQPEPEEERIDNMFTSWSQPWARTVFHAVAKLFFCNYYTAGKLSSTKLRHIYVGKVSNATTAALMGEYLVTSILRECRRLYRENLSPQSRAFATGAADKIYWRVDALIREQGEATPGTALVLASLYTQEKQSNDAHALALWGELKAGKSRERAKVDREAYNAGVEFGAKASLNAQLGTEEDVLKQLK